MSQATFDRSHQAKPKAIVKRVATRKAPAKTPAARAKKQPKWVTELLANAARLRKALNEK